MSIPTFKNQDLLVRALTHRSALNEQVSSSKISYERLEFLGDAVLELLTTQYLYHHFPSEPEGVLTAYRSSLVKTTTLAKVAKRLGLGEKLYMSKGEEAGGGRENPGLLADVFEAVTGALYLDQGIEVVDEFLKTQLFIEFPQIKEKKLYKDSKSYLQELVQSKGFKAPVYKVISQTGPDHDKYFVVVVLIDGQSYGQGKGKSKQEAHQSAAKVALRALNLKENQV